MEKSETIGGVLGSTYNVVGINGETNATEAVTKLPSTDSISNAVGATMGETNSAAKELKYYHSDMVPDDKQGMLVAQNRLVTASMEETTAYRIDEWSATIEKFFEFFQVPLCYLIKFSMVVLTVSTTCVYLAICLVATIKLILCFENGFIVGDISTSASNFMLSGVLFIVLVTWAYATTIIVSRQFEVLYIIYATPATFEYLKISQLMAKEENHLKQPSFRLTTDALRKVPYPQFPVLSICGIISIIFVIITIILFAMGNFSTGFFFLILFLIFATYITIWLRPRHNIPGDTSSLTRPINSMVSWAYLGTWSLMAIGGFVSGVMALCRIPSLTNDYVGIPIFGELVLGYVGTSAVLNLCHIGKYYK